MCFKWLCIVIHLLASVQGDIRDCIEGEIWYEICRRCRCFKNGKYTCEPHLPSCKLENCIDNVVVFGKNFRYHCDAKNNITVCVPLVYQQELDKKPCWEDFYYYDTCTFCKCNTLTKELHCIPIDNCNFSSGGICNHDETTFEDCDKCSCSFTKFRRCVPVDECYLEKEKPGKCYIIQSFFEAHIQSYCTRIINQECYTDYGCPGQKKCCHVVDCYLRCVDPHF